MSNSENSNKLALLKQYRDAFWSEPVDWHVILTLAESYLSAGAWEEAIRLAQLAVKTAPKSSLPHLLLGDAYREIGRLEDAALSYAAVAQADPDDDIAGNALYELVHGLPDGTRALSILRQVCTRYPDHAYFQETLAQLSHSLGGFSEAENIYRALLARNGFDPERRLDWEWRLSGVLIGCAKYTEGFALIERVLPQLGSYYNIAAIERALADDYLKAGRFESALELSLHRAESALPGRAKAEMLRKASRCYEELHEHDRAIECLIEVLTFVREAGSPDDGWIEQKTIISDPRFYEDIYAALTRNYEAKGDLVRAKETFKKEKEYCAKGVADSEQNQK